MKINECKLNMKSRKREKGSAIKEGFKENPIITLGYNEKTAIEESQCCLFNNICKSCDLCRLMCPDLCITRNKTTNRVEIDLEYCKGCGICAAVCPRGAIRMVSESFYNKM